MTTENIIYIIGAAIIAILIAAFHYYFKSKNNEKVNLLLTFLRFLSLFSLFLLLINPKIEQKIIKTIKPNLVVAVDNSSSIKHLKQSENVINLVNKLKENKALNAKFNIDYFSFSDEVQLLDSLNFDTDKTNISKPLKQFNELYKNAISPIVLLTDGNQTFGTNFEYQKIKNPVYSIVVGDTTKFSDLKITQQNVNRYTYLKNKFPVETFLNYQGNKKVNATYSVFEGKQKVFTKNVTFSKDNNAQNFSFYLPASEVGTHYYTSKISYLSNEKNKINNTKNFVVEVIDEQANVLILYSFLHPDVGALKKSIERNKQRKVTLKQIGSEVKVNDYQLVILYQPTKTFEPIFTEIENENKNFIIITGSKTDWKFLNKAQNYFTKNAINQTENYVPVFNQNYTTFVTDDIGFSDFPPLVDAFGEVKFNIPYERLLFQKIGSFATEKPLLVTFENNNRRGAVLFGENSWKWRMTSKLSSKSYEDYDSFIGKIVQYLSSNKKEERLLIDYKSFYYANDEIKILATYLDKNYQFDANATVWLSIKNKKTNKRTRFPFLLNGTRYKVSLSDLKSGDYSFIVTVDNQNTKVSGSFKVLDFNVEQQFANSNYQKLTFISKKTNGKIYFDNAVTKLEKELLIDKRFVSVQKSENKINSMIDWKWLLAVIILSLSIEWFIRKYRGLI